MKTITKRQFRIFLSLIIGTSLLSVVVSSLTDQWLLPKDLLDHLAAQKTFKPSGTEALISLAGAPGGLLLIVAVVGLFRFWPAARKLSVIAYTYLLIWMPFSPGAVVASPLTSAITNLAALLTGVVVALIYFSPAANWFEKPPKVTGEQILAT